eukprot:484811-Amphidinium_carterae.1
MLVARPITDRTCDILVGGVGGMAGTGLFIPHDRGHIYWCQTTYCGRAQENSVLSNVRGILILKVHTSSKLL